MHTHKFLHLQRPLFECYLMLNVMYKLLKLKLNQSMQQLRQHSIIRNPSRYDSKLLSYIILLRFGTVVNPDFTKPILNYQSIAKVIKKPVTTVIEIVKFAMQAYNYSFEIHPPS